MEDVPLWQLLREPKPLPRSPIKAGRRNQTVPAERGQQRRNTPPCHTHTHTHTHTPLCPRRSRRPPSRARCSAATGAEDAGRGVHLAEDAIPRRWLSERGGHILRLVVGQRPALSLPEPFFLCRGDHAEGDGQGRDGSGALAAGPTSPGSAVGRARREHRTANLLRNWRVPLGTGRHSLTSIQCHCYHHCYSHHLRERLLVLPEIHLRWMLQIHAGGTRQETGPKQIRRASVILILIVLIAPPGRSHVHL
ncbi:uncharacterized protein LOC133386123 [Rhineura floridana]|uniref:uncharacterized protein LOC133386123 n=1 Tax=Rhineura floridana TaxID=261503 RepID=UPI002AC82BC6|nr:uncharacterized protein LOC133386123 [Rhineura floridana]